jgi:hypothetical protein
LSIGNSANFEKAFPVTTMRSAKADTPWKRRLIESTMAKRVTVNELDRSGGPAWLRFQRLKLQLRHPFRYRALRDQCRKSGSIFVHIPKCAGTSLRESLGIPLGGHATLIDYQKRLPPEDFERAFKFTFVRNPWDRLVSGFFFLKNRDLKGNHTWAKKNLATTDDFDTFVRRWVTPENVWSFSHFRPQYYYVSLEHKMPAVDFVGYYENITADFPLLCEKLKIQGALQEENRNPIRKRDYVDYYTDETRRIVAEVYAKDIELFGYAFDNSSLSAQLSRAR